MITACFHGGPWDGLQLQHTLVYSSFCFQAHRPKDVVTSLPVMGMHGPLLPSGMVAEFYRPVQVIGTLACYAHIGRRWQVY